MVATPRENNDPQSRTRFNLREQILETLEYRRIEDVERWMVENNRQYAGVSF